MVILYCANIFAVNADSQAPEVSSALSGSGGKVLGPAATATGTAPPGLLDEAEALASGAVEEIKSLLGKIWDNVPTHLAGSKWEATAKRVYGDSINVSRVWFTTVTGLNDRAFTVANTTLKFGAIQIMNVGADPKEKTIIHELAHVWQSQHSSNPMQFMVNAVASQGLAAGLNVGDVNNPANVEIRGPFSAYAYLPGKPFGQYGAEQIARQADQGVTAILDHMKSVAPGAVDPDNESSLSVPRYENLNTPGVKG